VGPFESALRERTNEAPMSVRITDKLALVRKRDDPRYE
jgi:hypothetical protein